MRGLLHLRKHGNPKHAIADLEAALKIATGYEPEKIRKGELKGVTSYQLETVDILNDLVHAYRSARRIQNAKAVAWNAASISMESDYWWGLESSRLACWHLGMNPPMQHPYEVTTASALRDFIGNQGSVLAGATPFGSALQASSVRNVRMAAQHTEQRMTMLGRRERKTEETIFIGHGNSPAWRDLKDLLQDRLGLKPDEFNRTSAAGMTTKERLEEVLNVASFAFLVMTAEDEHSDTTKHARENVVHEAGLFQGRLGFRRAIILIEEDCAEFSNIHGIGQIRFPKGNIKSKSEEIRQVLEREGLLKK